MSEYRLINPIYQKIAIDIASRISNDELAVGSKLHGRSTLAAKYNVSPETIRRAIKLLEDVNIVKVNVGSGIVIISKEEAIKYIQKISVVDSVKSVKKQIINLMNTRNSIDNDISKSINQIIDYTERFKHTNSFVPFEIKIDPNSTLIGKTISETNFWQNTGATIIGIRRNNSVIVSPGPYALFENDDSIIFICDEASYDHCICFLNK